MRKNKGFTLIELMIVIAIIAIIAAIAIPNLMQSRLRANEATAVTCVRNYGTAQVTFQLGQQSSVTTNSNEDNSGLRGFADNYRNLFYGNPRTTPTGTDGLYNADTTRTLSLISQAMADAFIADADIGADTNNSPIDPTGAAPSGLGTPYQGYNFQEDSSIATSDGFFVTNYAMMACPANSATTGNSAYWMDSENSVLRRGLEATWTDNTAAADIRDDLADKSPLDPTQRGEWSPL